MTEAMFIDRHDAGRKLAALLKFYKSSDAIVYALSRGGVPVGYEIAKELNLPLELVITRKITHPDSPEYALGAVSQYGKYILSMEAQLIDKDVLNQQIEVQKKEIQRRRNVYYGNHEGLNCKGRTVIIVDDGVATGFSLRAAIDDMRGHNPKQIVVAVPVIPQDVVVSIQSISNSFFTLLIVKNEFGAVGKYYQNFNQLSDKEVKILLSHIWQKK